jgi:pimeloyl-ACP methyl ester carboxylesterase
VAVTCWGVKLALQTALQLTDRVNGVVVISPALRSEIGFRPLEYVKLVACAIGNPKCQFAIPIASVEMFSSDPTAIEFIRTDPLRVMHVTARFLVETWRLDRCNYRSLRKVAVPTVALFTGEDRILDPARITGLLHKMPSVDIRVVQGVGHSMVFRPASTMVAEEIRSWTATLSSSRR